DVLQGDGSIDFLPAVQLPGTASCAPGNVGALKSPFPSLVGACRTTIGGIANSLAVNAAQDSLATDGNDYLEGNVGNDVIFGNLGQDDIVGGSSDMFSLTTPARRGDGTDLLFGGSGTTISLNNVGDTTPSGHANDSDAIVGDNGDIYRLVSGGAYLQFAYDQSSGYEDRGTLRIVPRAITLLDYTPGGPDYANQAGPLVTGDIGAADEIHGDGGDDFIYGGAGDDVIFG